MARISEANSRVSPIWKGMTSEKYRLDPGRAREIRQKYPDRYPVAVENYEEDVPLRRRKFLVTGSTTMGELYGAIRRQVDGLKGHDALFTSVNYTLPPTSSLVHKHWDDHNIGECLYLRVVRENTFG